MFEAKRELRDALEFHALVKEFRTKKSIDWDAYGNRMLDHLERLYAKPGCQSHFAKGENSLAALSPDIVHDIIERIDEPCELEVLVDVEGTWGRKAQMQKANVEKSRFRREQTSVKKMLDRRWKHVLKRAPELHGKLELRGLCKYDGAWKKLYKALNPQFRELTLEYHLSYSPYGKDELKPMEVFLSKQLRFPGLRSLSLTINANLQIEESLLLDFCLSGKFESLNWNCRPLSPDFFVQTYNAFRSGRCAPDCKPRTIRGFIEKSALREFVATLGVRKRKKNDTKFRREERPLLAADRLLSVTVEHKNRARVDVCIELTHEDVVSMRDQSNVREQLQRKTPLKVVAEIDDEFEHVGEDDVQNDEENSNDEEESDGEDEKDWFDGESICGADCGLEDYSDDQWSDIDCEDCDGCEYCRKPKMVSCNYCKIIHQCSNYDE